MHRDKITAVKLMNISIALHNCPGPWVVRAEEGARHQDPPPSAGHSAGGGQRPSANVSPSRSSSPFAARAVSSAQGRKPVLLVVPHAPPPFLCLISGGVHFAFRSLGGGKDTEWRLPPQRLAPPKCNILRVVLPRQLRRLPFAGFFSKGVMLHICNMNT